MSHVLTDEASAPVGRWRRTLGLAAVVGGVFIATLDLQAKNQASSPFPVLLIESWADAVPTGGWVSHAVYATIVIASLPLWGKLSDM